MKTKKLGFWKKAQALLLSGVMLLGLIPALAGTASAAGTIRNVSNASQLYDAAEDVVDGDTIRLTADFTGTCMFQTGGNYTLDLNGHTLTGDKTAIVYVYGSTVTLIDSAGGGKLMTGTTNVGNVKTAVLVYGNGTFIMNGGTLCPNPTDPDATGIHMYQTSTTIMNGGLITGFSGSADSENGAGVTILGSSPFDTVTFTMNGGEISGNSTMHANSGGGISEVCGNIRKSEITIHGGVIKNNHGTCGGGIYANSLSSNVTTDGDAIITGNVSDTLAGGVGCYGNMLISGNALIENNYSKTGSGGVRVYKVLTLNGGKVINNGTEATDAVSGGGIYQKWATNGQSLVNVSGNPVIKDNTVGASFDEVNRVVIPGNTNSDLAVSTENSIVLAGDLAGSVGVYFDNGSGSGMNPGDTFGIANADSYTGAKNFFNDENPSLTPAGNNEKDLFGSLVKSAVNSDILVWDTGIKDVIYPEYGKDNDGDNKPDKGTETVQTGEKIQVVLNDSPENRAHWVTTSAIGDLPAGDYTGEQTHTITINTDVTLTPDPTRDGFVFMGWTKVAGSGDIAWVFTAQWAVDVKGNPDDPENQGDGVPDKYQKKVTFKIENGTWDGTAGNNADKIVYVTLMTAGKWDAFGSGSLTAPEGMVPVDDSYGGGDWIGIDPPATVSGTDEATYTYRFAENQIITYPEAGKDNNGDNKPDDSQAEVQNGKQIQIVLNDSPENRAHWVTTSAIGDLPAGDYTGEQTHTITIDNDVMLTPDPTRDDFVFMGWTKTAGSGDITWVFTAQWEEDTKGNPDDPDNKGDGIPDKFQGRVSYTVTGGALPGGVTAKVEYLPLIKNGLLSEDGTATAVMPAVTADSTHTTDGAAWTPADTTVTKAGKDYTFDCIATGIKFPGTTDTPDENGGLLVDGMYTLKILRTGDTGEVGLTYVGSSYQKHTVNPTRQDGTALTADEVNALTVSKIAVYSKSGASYDWADSTTSGVTVTIANGKIAVKGSQSVIAKVTVTDGANEAAFVVIIPGDINLNGRITAADSSVLAGVLNGKQELNQYSYQKLMTDMNNDTLLAAKIRLNTGDSSIMAYMLNGKILPAN